MSYKLIVFELILYNLMSLKHKNLTPIPSRAFSTLFIFYLLKYKMLQHLLLRVFKICYYELLKYFTAMS